MKNIYDLVMYKISRAQLQQIVSFRHQTQI